MANDINQLLALIDQINKIVNYNFFKDIINVVIIVISILLTVEIIGFVVKRKFSKSRKFPHEVVGGFLNIMRVIAAFIILFSILTTFGIVDYETLLSFTTIMSTAIGLASAIVIGNLIAGFYMIGSRPYGVGDYVTIGSTEGFITEIGLNYTTIKDCIGNIHKIPNKVAMTANLINYKTPLSEASIEQTGELTTKGKIKKTFNEFVKAKKISKYIFKMEFELDINPSDLIRILEEVFERWAAKFGYKPQMLFEWISWRIAIRAVITTDNMVTTMNLFPYFLDDIWVSIYGLKIGSQGD